MYSIEIKLFNRLLTSYNYFLARLCFAIINIKIKNSLTILFDLY